MRRSIHEYEYETFAAWAIMAIMVLALASLFVIVPAYFEARAYERVTGKSVSTWDAVWLQLRVDGEAK